jgi:hypothetical protein
MNKRIQQEVVNISHRSNYTSPTKLPKEISPTFIDTLKRLLFSKVYIWQISFQNSNTMIKSKKL